MIEMLRSYPTDAIHEVLKTLTPAECEEILHCWELWARPKQLAPKGNWKILLALAGRGFGKTRMGTEWVRQQIKAGKSEIGCVAPTKGDVRAIMVEGPSGLLNVCSKTDKTNRGVFLGFPVWSPTNNTVTWANGAKARFYSAEDPERLRGPNLQAAWCDELCSWNRMQETWDMLQMTLRIGKNPQIFISTTPKPSKLLIALNERAETEPDKVIRVSGSSYDNAENINLDALKAFEGTRLGRQELYAEILTQAAGALWTADILKAAYDPSITDTVKFAEENLARVIVSVDPAITSNVESDDTGIIVAGVDINGIGYILEDHTGKFTPQGWASKAISLYHKFSADTIVAEKNQGGDMVRSTLQSEDETIPVRLVHASRGKYARAEPVSSLYEQGKVKHARDLDKLEQQMTTWEPLGSIGSPDRLDACVWAITNLMLKNVARPKLELVYQNANSVKK
jgi:phage terminase large subunit-like protein